MYLGFWVRWNIIVYYESHYFKNLSSKMLGFKPNVIVVAGVALGADNYT